MHSGVEEILQDPSAMLRLRDFDPRVCGQGEHDRRVNCRCWRSVWSTTMFYGRERPEIPLSLSLQIIRNR